MDDTVFTHGNYTVRHWMASDRKAVAALVQECLESYGLEFEAQGADLDAIAVEDHYLRDGRGEFWVVVDQLSSKIVGSGGYYEVSDESKGEEVERKGITAVEIRKMYLLPEARGKKLGRTMLEVRLSLILIKWGVQKTKKALKLIGTLLYIVYMSYVYYSVCVCVIMHLISRYT